MKKRGETEQLGEQCPGISHSWAAKYKGEPHTAADRYENCWSCGADLGCRRCSGRREELLCMNRSGRVAGGHFFGHGKVGGPVWATRRAFIKHGLFAGQKLEDYPAEWHAEYRRTAQPAAEPVSLDQLIRKFG